MTGFAGEAEVHRTHLLHETELLIPNCRENVGELPSGLPDEIVDCETLDDG